MHDIDRTLGQEFPPDFEAELGFELDEAPDFDGEFEFEAEDGGLSEEAEIDLAAELLSLQGDEELDQFIGRLARRIGRGAIRAIRSPAGRAIGSALRGVAKRALPVVGAAVGSAIAPGVGTKVGGMLGNAASQMFEVDLDEMEPEDAQFEIARRFVRLASAAVRGAQRVARNPHVQQAARQALIAAARQHAPGLARALDHELGEMPGSGRGARRRRGQSGRWVRRGETIVLLGIR
jgi:hypothetical protein